MRDVAVDIGKSAIGSLGKFAVVGVCPFKITYSARATARLAFLPLPSAIVGAGSGRQCPKPSPATYPDFDSSTAARG